MFDSVDRFTKKIDGLLKYIEYEEKLVELFKAEASSGDNTPLNSFITTIYTTNEQNKKQFNYNSIIVSLYGALERLVEDLAKETVEEINSIVPKYKQLSTKIRNVHLDLSMDLIKKYKRHNKESLEKNIKTVLTNLNSCISKNREYQLNSKAFTLHTANFRFLSINDLFTNIDFERVCQRAAVDAGLRQALCNLNDSNTSQSSILEKYLTTALDDLAERRNEVSHGAVSTDIESLELLKQRVELIQFFGKALAKVLESDLIKLKWSHSEKKEIGVVNKGYPLQKVISFDACTTGSCVRSLPIDCNSKVFVKNDANGMVYEASVTGICIKKNGKIKKTHKLRKRYSGEFSLALDLCEDLPNSVYTKSIVYYQ